MIKIKIPEKEIKNKFYSTYYFTKTNQLLKKYNSNHISTLQFICFNNEPYMLCGIDEVIQIIKVFLKPKDFNSLTIMSRKDGDIINKNEPVLLITGKYYLICELENIIDGVLARRSSVATNCWKILKQIKTNQLIYMADRSDDYIMHPYDGYAAYVAGVRNFSNYSHVAFINDKNVKVYGSMPHALIHQYKNDINALLNDYIKMFPSVSLLVDFSNDIIKTLSSIDQKYIKYINSIRIDTSKNIIDQSLNNKNKQNKKLQGVNHELIILVRDWMDQNGFKKVKITSTSDNNVEKIIDFKNKKTPIDFYGIGTALIQVNLHFTADLVTLDNIMYAKVGRKLLFNSKLKKYTFKK